MRTCHLLDLDANRGSAWRIVAALMVCISCSLFAQPVGEDSPGQAKSPRMAEEVRTQLEKLAAAISLARIDWTETDAGEGAKVFAAPQEFSAWFERGKFRVRTVYTYAKGYGYDLRGGREAGEVS